MSPDTVPVAYESVNDTFPYILPINPPTELAPDAFAVTLPVAWQLVIVQSVDANDISPPAYWEFPVTVTDE